MTFVLVRSEDTEIALRESLGEAASIGRTFTDDRHGQVGWQVSAEGSGADDLYALVDGVLAQINDHREHLLRVCAAGRTECLLRIVQYVAEDSVGPGLGLSAEQIALLAELHASLDVDQYWVSA